MTSVRFRDPKAITERTGRLSAAMKAVIDERARLLEAVRADADAEEGATKDTLARALGTVQGERERYRELFEAAPDAYFVTDKNGIIREANERAAAVVGVDARYVCGKPITVYVGSDATAAVRDALLDSTKADIELTVGIVGRKKQPTPMRMRARRLDDGRRILWIARPDEGSLPGDGTDLSRALRDKEDLLERERGERERLERESRVKDRFLAVLSHDLRSPLNAVLGWAELLRRELLDQGRREHALSAIDRNARALLGLVDELLDISRISTDRMQIDVKPIDVSALVKRVVDATHPSAREKGITLGCTVQDVVIIVADAKRIEQSVMNLLSNALKFTPSGGRIDVAVERTGDRVEITVRDTGKGIPAGMLPHVFECFRQGDDQGLMTAGLGLGLYIVREIAHLHGGSASAQSEGEGRGATFVISLPVADAGPTASEINDASGMLSELTSMRVLVVDDDEDTRELLTTLLGDAGAHVAAAATPIEATALIASWSPDAIVTDMSMQTHEDGLSVVRAARARLGDDVIVVALSGFTAERDAERSIAAGFDAHLAKPLSSGELIAALVRLRETRGGPPRSRG